MTLDTNSDVEEVRKVQGPNGAKEPPSNQKEQAATNDRLGNFAGLEQFVYTTSGTSAEALTSKSVPEGVTVLVEYAEGNAGNVYLGDSETQQAPLTAVGSGREFRVSDTSAIHVRTPTSGDGVIVSFEVTA